MKGDLKLNIKVNPGYLAEQVLKSGVYEVYTDCLLDLAAEFQENSPIGATRELIQGWDVQSSPKKVAYGFEVRSNITNSSSAAVNRIAGRAPGTPPPVQPLVDWTIKKGLATNPKKALGIAFAIRNKIAKRGTDRYIAKDNWVGINPDGSQIPGGRLEEAEKAIQRRLGRRL
jgi:hypothetical protein